MFSIMFWNLLYFRSPGDSVALKTIMGADFPGDYTPGDMAYITGLTVFNDILADQWLEYCIRGM